LLSELAYLPQEKPKFNLSVTGLVHRGHNRSACDVFTVSMGRKLRE